MKNQKGNVLIILLIVVLVAIAIIIWWTKKPKQAEVSTQPPTELITTVNYLCDQDKSIIASFFSDKVELVLSDNRNLTLMQAVSASGARYANENESIVFWEKGDESFIEENNKQTFTNCKESPIISDNISKADAQKIEKLIENYILAKKTRNLEKAKIYMSVEYYNSTNQEKFAGPSSPQIGRYKIASIEYSPNDYIYKTKVKVYQNLQEQEAGYTENTFDIIKVSGEFLVDGELEGEFIETN